MRGVNMIKGSEYRWIDDEDLYIAVEGEERVLAVDHDIICAGKDPLRELQERLQQLVVPAHLIGGVNVAAELDAQRAIDQGTRLAAGLLGRF